MKKINRKTDIIDNYTINLVNGYIRDQGIAVYLTLSILKLNQVKYVFWGYFT